MHADLTAGSNEMPDAAGSSAPIYTAERIGAVLARNTFKDSLCVVDRCTRMGSECDLLVVTPNLRPVDVEIKISRADLKADRAKHKWFDFGRWDTRSRSWNNKTPRDWPEKIWKHYYIVAAPIWRDDLLNQCQPKSGVITIELLDEPRRYGRDYVLTVKRRATPNRACSPLSHEVVVDIARLASLRMWDAYANLGRVIRERDHDLARGTA